jgi:hypothetical protein
MAHDVFISHSSVNKKAADAICHALEQNGVKCWIAPRDIPPGANYGGEIIKGIKNWAAFSDLTGVAFLGIIRERERRTHGGTILLNPVAVILLHP